MIHMGSKRHNPQWRIYNKSLTATRSSGFETCLSLRYLSGRKPKTPLSSCVFTPTAWPGHSPASKWFHTYTQTQHTSLRHTRSSPGSVTNLGVSSKMSFEIINILFRIVIIIIKLPYLINEHSS